MKKLKLQHYVLLILSFMAFIAASMAYIFMYHDAVKKAEEELAVHQSVLMAAKQNLEFQNMQAEYQNTAANRALLPSFLVSIDDAVPFIDAVEAIGPATNSTVSISSLSAGTDSGSSNSVVTASVSASGSWANVMRAVQMIEDIPYAISEKTLNLDTSYDPSAKSDPNWTAVLDISVLSSQ